MSDHFILIAGLCLGTFAIRLSGFLVGARLPSDGPWARAFNALPGCLIASLLSVLIMQGDDAEWIASACALGVAIVSKNLLATMFVGIACVWALRMVL